MLKFVSSIRLAILLIAALAGLSVSATLYDRPEMFHSLPFLALAAAFFVNLLTCTVKLWPGLLRRWQRRASDLVGREASWQESALDEAELRALLAQKRFRIDAYAEEGHRYLLARRGKASLLAPHLLHIGILVVMVGAFLSGFAVKDQLTLVEGQSAAMPEAIAGHVEAKRLSVERFETRYDAQGAVDNWVTTFRLEGAGAPVKGETRVNHPYKSGGLSIYQMAYASRYEVRIESDDPRYAGSYEFPEDQKIPLPDGAIAFSPMAEELILYTHYDRDGKVTDERALRPGDGMHLWPGTTVYYERPVAVTVLELKYDRSVPIVFLGFFIACLGCLLFWTGRYQELAIALDPAGRVRMDVRTKGRRLREALIEDFALAPSGKETPLSHA